MKKLGMLLLTLSLFGISVGCGGAAEETPPAPPAVDSGDAGAADDGAMDDAAGDDAAAGDTAE